MSSFTANSSTPSKQDPIAAGDFWPRIEMDVLRETIRIPGDVTPQRLRATVVMAVMSVMAELDSWRTEREAAGYRTLNEVPAAIVDGQPYLVQLFLRAVYCATAVELHERYRSYDATAQGNQRADDLSPTIDEMRRDLRNAISDLLGTRRVTVELI